MPLNEPNQTISKVYGQPILGEELPYSNDRLIQYSPSCCTLPFEYKHANELFDYIIDMMSWLEPNEVIIGAAAWCDPDSLIATRLEYAPTGVVVWLAGGGDGVRQTVNIEVSTNLGRIKIVQFIVQTTGIADELALVTVEDDQVVVGLNTQTPIDPALVPLLVAYPNTLTFPETIASVGESSQTIILKNEGNAPAYLLSFDMDGPFLQHNAGQQRIDPNQFVQVTITYKPMTLGEHTGAINVNYGDGLQQLATFTGEATSGNRLLTAGNQIIRPGGVTHKLKSINWFGAETQTFVPHGLWSRNYKEIIDQIADMGFNSVRLPFSGDLCNISVNPSDGAINYTLNEDLIEKSAVEVLDAIIAYMNQKQLHVILDHHRRKAGDGTDGTPIAVDYTLANWQASWQFMADRYGDVEFVLGADLHNEPHLLDWATWAGYAETTANLLHETAPHWLIFVEGVSSYGSNSYWWGGELSGVRDRPITLKVANRLVYSVHEYGISVGDQPWLAKDATIPASWPFNLYGVWREHWGFIFEESIAPVWIGEVGGKFGIDGTGTLTMSNNMQFEHQWIYHLQRYMGGYFTGDDIRRIGNNDQGISFAYWALNPNSGDTGGILQDDWLTEQSFKLELISMMLSSITPSYLAGLSPLAWDQVNDNGQLVFAQGGKDYAITLTAFLDAARDRLYEPGEVHFFAVSVDPNERYAGQSWVRVPGVGKTIRLAAADDLDLLAEGGSDSVTIAKANLPATALSLTGTASSVDLGTKTAAAAGGHTHAIDSGTGVGDVTTNFTNGDAVAGTQVNTSSAGSHTHDVVLGSHSHTVSGSTENMGSGTALNVTNQFVKLAAWYRVS